MLFDAHQTIGNEDVNEMVAKMRRLTTDLIANDHHETAQKVAAIGLEAFDLMPGDIEPFNQTAAALRTLSREASIKQLENLIQISDREPSLIARAIEKKGFGKGSNDAARALWEAFLAAVTATIKTELQEQPWILIRDFASRLGVEPESEKSATRLISDLLRFGATLSATPTTLDTLRRDLSKLETTHGPTDLSRTISYAKAVLFFILTSTVIFCAFLVYRHLNRGSAPLTVAAPQLVPSGEPEAIPPPSTGERFNRDLVRYCNFQEERLRVIKQHVQGPQDSHAYNMLANDYNSRCSNFYYLDEDLKVVKEELNARRQILESDAMRILSTWPWHAASGIPPKPAVK